MIDLKELCSLNGASGYEKAVEDKIKKELSAIGGIRFITDNLGSIIVEKKGKSTPQNRIMVSAHMDEVGFIITYIDENGFLKFDAVGGVDPRAVFGKRVIVNGLTGVVGVVPVHLLGDDEKDIMPKITDMYIDIGAKSREEAEKYVSLGDFAYFESEYVAFGTGMIKSKALDDRFGCSVLLNLLKADLPYDVTVCFVTQEEVGLKGASAAANRVNPDIGLIIEATTANDVSGVEGAEKVCSIGKGAVVSFMDGRTVYDRKLYNLAVKTAQKNGISVQTKTKIAGGNDAGAVQVAGNGTRVCAVSLPARYIHSGSSVASKEDMKSVEKLIYKLVETFGRLEKI